jgi:thymidylate synthase ThyX
MPERPEREIYLLSPSELTPETIAVAFAKTSRSPLSFREIADELTAESSAEFHEKWVVGYGHASVAEHAVLHIAFENVSRLAIECIESNRLASYTEKSTRYQTWDSQSYHIPDELEGSPHRAGYIEICDRLFASYRSSLEPVRAVVEKQHPQREGESGSRYDGRIRSKYVDACRFFLPAAALANVGMTANARVLEHAIRKMLSHPLAEVRQIGEQLKQVAKAETPTLVKYAERVPYLVNLPASLARHASGLPTAKEPASVRLVSYEEHAVENLLAAAIFSQAGCSMDQARSHVAAMARAEQESLLGTIFDELDQFDIPSRLLEHITYTFEVVLDQGAYFELKRHRMMTQTPQTLSTELGYAVPHLLVEGGQEQAYRQAMSLAQDGYRSMEPWSRDVAAYLVPNGFNRRVLLTLNLREAYHLCELRSAANAHFSIRVMALHMAGLIHKVHPGLAKGMRLPAGADWQEIANANFTQV